MRRVAGIAFIAGGVGLLTLAGARYARGAIAADRARAEWDASEAHAVVANARLAAFTPVRAVKDGEPVARVIIPRIGLDEIVLEGVTEDDLDALPGHFPGSAMPGARGNAVISAHRDRHFRHFDDIRAGDSITTESPAGRVKWIVVSTRVVPKDAPALFHTRDATLTLTTCWPIRYVGSAPSRLIVTAKPVEARGKGAAARG